MAKEIELKLETDSAGIAALLAAGPPETGTHEAALKATYFDTPDHGLRRAHLSLRIRCEGKNLVQTLKHSTGASAGLFARGEWEQPVAGMTPVIVPDTPLAQLLERTGAELTPTFEVEVQRFTALIDFKSAQIELAFDRGEVRAAGRCAPIREVELELLGGSAAALFALARQLDAQVPLRIGVLTKSERGYRLLGPAETCSKAEPVRLHVDDSAEHAFLAVAASCIRQYRLNEAMLLQRIAPGPVHQARIALRRLRTTMTLFKPLVGGTRSAALSRRLGALAMQLGEVRDLDVLSAKAAPSKLRDRFAAARRDASARLERALAGREPRRLMLDLAEWLALGDWRSDPDRAEERAMPLRDFAQPALDRLRRKVRSHGHRLRSLPAEQRHRLRKDGKKLRYAVDILGGLYARGKPGKRRRHFAKALATLQESLGGLNDQAAAAKRLASLGLAGLPEAQHLLSCWPVDSLIDQAVDARHQMLKTEPFWR